MLWAPDRWRDDTEETGFRPRWIGSTAYNSINLPMEPEEEDEQNERDKEG